MGCGSHSTPRNLKAFPERNQILSRVCSQVIDHLWSTFSDLNRRYKKLLTSDHKGIPDIGPMMAYAGQEIPQ